MVQIQQRVEQVARVTEAGNPGGALGILDSALRKPAPPPTFRCVMHLNRSRLLDLLGRTDEAEAAVEAPPPLRSP